MKSEMYFAYGSNIYMKQMKERCSSSKFISRAILQGHQIIFPLFSDRWDGGVAGISSKENSQIEGVVYEMSEEDLKKLDGFEGVDKGYYFRDRVKVLIEDGATLEAWTYYTGDDHKDTVQPSQRYLKTIIKGAEEHGLSEKYIEYLRHLLSELT